MITKRKRKTLGKLIYLIKYIRLINLIFVINEIFFHRVTNEN